MAQSYLTQDMLAEIEALNGEQRQWIREQMSQARVALWELAYEKANQGYVVQIMDGERLVSQLMHKDADRLNGEAVSFDMTPRIG